MSSWLPGRVACLQGLQKFNVLERPTGDNQDPLHRLFSREGNIGRNLLTQVRRDLSDVVKVCLGELKQTNHLRTLMSALTKGESCSSCILWPVLMMH